MLSPSRKGAETALVHAAVVLGFDVYRPVQEATRYDLILDVGDRLLRVQYKWAVRRANVIVVPCYSNRRIRDGQSRRTYTAEEIDAFGAYCSARPLLSLPIDQFSTRSAIQLRLAAPLNNQALRINWARDFELGATLSRHQGP